MATAGSIVIDLLMKTGSFVTDTQRAEKAMKGLQTTAKSVSTGITQAFAGVAAGIAAGLSVGATVSAFTTGINNAIAAADRLDELSSRFSLSTETLSGWGYAAKMTGSDIEGLASAIPKFTKTVTDAADASSEAGKVFAALGISVRDQAGNLRSVEELLPEVADRFKDLDNVTTETAVAMQLFGRSGAEFLEFLNLGSDGLQGMEDRARALGVVIDSDTTAAAARFNDRLDDLRAATNGWFTQISAELLPVMTELTEEMTDFVRDGGEAATVARDIADSLRLIAGAARALFTLGDWLDDVRGGLVAVEKQGHAVFKLFTGQYSGLFGTQGGGFKGFLDEYQGASTWAEEGWAAGQQSTAATTGQAIPAGARSGPRGRRSRATAEEVAETKAYAERLKAAEEYQRKLDAIFSGSGGDPTNPPAAKAAKETKKELDETDQILKDLEMLERSWADAAADVTAEAARRQEQYDRVNQDILDTIDLLGMTRDEQEQWNALAWAGVDATSEQGKELLANIDKMQEVRNATMDQVDAMNALRGAGSDFFTDWTSGAKSFKDAGLDALDSLNERLLSMIAENLMGQLFGKSGDAGGGQWGDLVGSVFSSIFGGADGFASGGYTGAGSKNKPAGVVHKGEYVFSADAVSRLGLDFLSGLDRGWIGEDGEEQRSGVTLLVPPVRSTPIIFA